MLASLFGQQLSQAAGVKYAKMPHSIDWTRDICNAVD